jgi:hypothetical protein
MYPSGPARCAPRIAGPEPGRHRAARVGYVGSSHDCRTTDGDHGQPVGQAAAHRTIDPGDDDGDMTSTRERNIDHRGTHSLAAARALLTLDDAAIFSHIDAYTDNSTVLGFAAVDPARRAAAAGVLDQPQRPRKVRRSGQSECCARATLGKPSRQSADSTRSWIASEAPSAGVILALYE